MEGKPPMMVEYKLTEGVAEYINHPSLKGVYVGSFMIIEAWDDSAKVKYQSSPYFTNDNHVWINDKNKAFGGQQFTPEEAKNALGRKGLNTEVVQKNGTLFCIKNAKNGRKKNQKIARALRA